MWTQTQEKVDRIIEIGVGRADGAGDVDVTEDVVEEAIDFQTIYRPNADLAVGETQVVQERQNGTLRKTYEIRTTNGESKRYLVLRLLQNVVIIMAKRELG